MPQRLVIDRLIRILDRHAVSSSAGLEPDRYAAHPCGAGPKGFEKGNTCGSLRRATPRELKARIQRVKAAAAEGKHVTGRPAGATAKPATGTKPGQAPGTKDAPRKIPLKRQPPTHRPAIAAVANAFDARHAAESAWQRGAPPEGKDILHQQAQRAYDAAQTALKAHRKAQKAAHKGDVMTGKPHDETTLPHTKGEIKAPEPTPAAPLTSKAPAMKTESKIEYVRAPAGGAKSDVTGQFYKGGQLMPVHGLFAGQERTPKGNGIASAPSAPDAESKGRERPTRTPPKPLTSEDIAAKRQAAERQTQWDAVRNGPLGSMISMGGHPHEIKRGPGLTPWSKWAETATSERIQAVADAAREIYIKNSTEQEAKRYPNEDRTELARQIGEHFDHSIVHGGNEAYLPKAHQKKVPGSATASTALSYAVPEASIADLHRLHEIMAGGGASPPVGGPSPPPKATAETGSSRIPAEHAPAKPPWNQKSPHDRDDLLAQSDRWREQSESFRESEDPGERLNGERFLLRSHALARVAKGEDPDAVARDTAKQFDTLIKTTVPEEDRNPGEVEREERFLRKATGASSMPMPSPSGGATPPVGGPPVGPPKATAPSPKQGALSPDAQAISDEGDRRAAEHAKVASAHQDAMKRIDAIPSTVERVKAYFDEVGRPLRGMEHIRKSLQSATDAELTTLESHVNAQPIGSSSRAAMGRHLLPEIHTEQRLRREGRSSGPAHANQPHPRADALHDIADTIDANTPRALRQSVPPNDPRVTQQRSLESDAYRRIAKGEHPDAVLKDTEAQWKMFAAAHNRKDPAALGTSGTGRHGHLTPAVGKATPFPHADPFAGQRIAESVRRQLGHLDRGATKELGYRVLGSLDEGSPNRSPGTPPRPAATPAKAPPTAPTHAGTEADFHSAFRAAFAEADRTGKGAYKGGNMVTLHALRSAFPHLSRTEFDAELRKLRLAGHVSLDSHEGLAGALTPEQRDAAIHEGGSRLVHASLNDHQDRRGGGSSPQPSPSPPTGAVGGSSPPPKATAKGGFRLSGTPEKPSASQTATLLRAERWTPKQAAQAEKLLNEGIVSEEHKAKLRPLVNEYRRSQAAIQRHGNPLPLPVAPKVVPKPPELDPRTATAEKSPGHIGFVGSYEYIRGADGHIYTAHIDSPMDHRPGHGRIGAQFESTAAAWPYMAKRLGLDEKPSSLPRGDAAKAELEASKASRKATETRFAQERRERAFQQLHGTTRAAAAKDIREGYRGAQRGDDSELDLIERTDRASHRNLIHAAIDRGAKRPTNHASSSPRLLISRLAVAARHAADVQANLDRLRGISSTEKR